MQFTSLRYIGFFILLFALYWALKPRFRSAVVLAASLLFYALFGLPALAVLGVCITVTFFGALLLEKRRTKPIFAAVLAAALAPLLFFKYFAVLFSAHAPEGLTAFSLMPVIGLSFYTFKSIAYLAEVFKGSMPACRSFARLALYLSFFAQVSMGPIQRPNDLLLQLETPKEFQYDFAIRGAQMMLWGYFQKLVIADPLGGMIHEGFRRPDHVLGLSVFFATVLFGLQLYAEFSGYSCIAIGSMQLLGFSVPDNFRAPYLSSSVREFWGRWHISLSSWLRDYVYIPLGGSRCSLARCCINLLITFFISGLWHGTGMQFVVWGLLHGMYLVFGRISAPVRSRLWKAVHIREDGCFARMVKTLVTLFLVWIGWVFFHAQSVPDALHLFARMLSEPAFSLGAAKNALVMLGFNEQLFVQLFTAWAAFAALDIASAKTGFRTWIAARRKWVQAAVCYMLILFILFLAPAGASPSPVYFQF